MFNMSECYIPHDFYDKSTETFFEEWVEDPNGTYKAVPVYKRRNSDEVMTLEQFNEYYKRNETATNHIVVI